LGEDPKESKTRKKKRRKKEKEEEKRKKKEKRRQVTMEHSSRPYHLIHTATAMAFKMSHDDQQRIHIYLPTHRSTGFPDPDPLDSSNKST
jgi:hypothetical protein